MFSSFFKEVPAWDMQRAQAFIKDSPSDAYTLVDVRQPEEYAEEHIPGAVLMPLGELARRCDEIPKDRLVLVYCRSGGRAGNGVMQLVQAGFTDVHNIGGMMQWQGLVAGGPPRCGNG